MNDVTRGTALPPEYSQLLAGFLRSSADVMPHDGAAEWYLSAEAIAAGIEAGRKLFPMPEVEGDTRFQVQLRWWSMCGVLVGPSLACVLVPDRVPAWQWPSWFAFLRDDYWVGFQAQQFESISAEDVDELKDTDKAPAHFLEPLAQAVGEVGEIKPTPLWAVAVDAVANAVISTGNELMEPWHGALIDKHVVKGMQRVHRAPLPRFMDSCGSEVRLWDEAATEAGEEPDFDVVTHPERTTCCMTCYSPDADLCVPCPKRSHEERHQLWAHY